MRFPFWSESNKIWFYSRRHVSQQVLFSAKSIIYDSLHLQSQNALKLTYLFLRVRTESSPAKCMKILFKPNGNAAPGNIVKQFYFRSENLLIYMRHRTGIARYGFMHCFNRNETFLDWKFFSFGRMNEARIRFSFVSRSLKVSLKIMDLMDFSTFIVFEGRKAKCNVIMARKCE